MPNMRSVCWKDEQFSTTDSNDIKTRCTAKADGKTMSRHFTFFSNQPREKQIRNGSKTAKQLFSSSTSTSTSSMNCDSQLTINIGNGKSENYVSETKFVSLHYTIPIRSPAILPKSSHHRSEAVQSFKSEMQGIYLSDAQQQKTVRAASSKQASAVAHIRALS